MRDSTGVPQGEIGFCCSGSSCHVGGVVSIEAVRQECLIACEMPL